MGSGKEAWRAGSCPTLARDTEDHPCSWVSSLCQGDRPQAHGNWLVLGLLGKRPECPSPAPAIMGVWKEHESTWSKVRVIDPSLAGKVLAASDLCPALSPSSLP